MKQIFLFLTGVLIAATGCGLGDTCAESISTFNGMGPTVVLDKSEGADPYMPTEEIAGPFHVLANYDYTIETLSSGDVPCSEEFVGSVIESTITISVNKSIEFNGEELLAGDNLLLLDEVTLIHFDVNGLTIDFGQDFIDKSQFQEKDHEWTLEFEADNGIFATEKFNLLMMI